MIVMEASSLLKRETPVKSPREINSAFELLSLISDTLTSAESSLQGLQVSLQKVSKEMSTLTTSGNLADHVAEQSHLNSDLTAILERLQTLNLGILATEGALAL